MVQELHPVPSPTDDQGASLAAGLDRHDGEDVRTVRLTAAHRTRRRCLPPRALSTRAAASANDITYPITCTTGLGRRVSVAARWHSNYFWSAGEDASVLALGVALDSLVGSNAGLPTRTLAERFALLHPDPHQRPSRAALFKEMYSARSSIAHGSRSSKLDDREFIRTMAAEVKWSAHRVLAAEETFGLNTDADFEEMLEGLRWGTTAWPG